MAYSIDLRQRVVNFVRSGGKRIDASKRFLVSLWSVDDWCKRKDLKPIAPPGRPRKNLDWEGLRKDIECHPDKLLRERAQENGVRINAIWYATRQMKISHKKNATLYRTPSVKKDRVFS